jgi:hypothetical protein
VHIVADLESEQWARLGDTIPPLRQCLTSTNAGKARVRFPAFVLAVAFRRCGRRVPPWVAASRARGSDSPTLRVGIPARCIIGHGG